MLDLWFKDAVVYCLDVETYADSDGDGIGDFAGLTRRLDYLAGIGVTCLWLLPFYTSPNRDNGYDISDYYSVDPRHGNLGDFVEFTHQASLRGIRVIVDLVVNHTSDQHPWFQMACRDPEGPFYDYYVWSKQKPKDDGGVVFPGVQKSTWTYHQQVGAYYFHRFYDFQPDLNIGNPVVRDEILKIMGFWIQLGVSGFRLDAAPFLVDMTGIKTSDLKDPMDFLTQMREFLSWRSRDAIILAEANLEPKETKAYFGDDDRFHMMFNFFLNQHVFLALARGEAAPIVKALRAVPSPPRMAQWAIFLRNHDEIDLGRLSDQERQEVFAEMGPEENEQLYDRGIRRRLAPMLHGDRARIELAFSLLFTLPGTPVFWYGDEIGMGDELALPEREGVRTPMQWAAKPNGGFSTAPKKQLAYPVIDHGAYGYEHVNVATQRRDPDSLLNWVERIIRTRKECRELGWGRPHVIRLKQANILALCYEWQGSAVLAVHNLSREGGVIELNLRDHETERLVDLLGDRSYHPLEDGKCELLLEGYGYRWFRLDGGCFSAG